MPKTEKTAETAECGPPSPPKVKWAPRAGWKRTKDPNKVKRFVEDALEETWNRMPAFIREIIDHYMLDALYLANVSNPSEESEDMDFGCSYRSLGRVILESNGVLINVAWFSQTDEGRIDLMWVIAHEFAHIYMTAMQVWAYLWLADGSSKGAEARSWGGKKTPPIVEMAVRYGSSFARGGTGQDTHKSMMDRGYGEYMADTFALVWGFRPATVDYYGRKGHKVSRRTWPRQKRCG